MKYDDIEISRQLETSVPVGNETQRVLREALMRLGPNGEKWCRNWLVDGDGNSCARGALHVAISGNAEIRTYEHPAYLSLKKVAYSLRPDLGFSDNPLNGGTQNTVGLFNRAAKDFSEVRAMFLKAIELAA